MTTVDGWGAVRLVAGRELRVRLNSRAFKIVTAGLLIVVVGLSVAVKLVGNSGGSKVGFTSSASALAQPLQSLAGAMTPPTSSCRDTSAPRAANTRAYAT